MRLECTDHDVGSAIRKITAAGYNLPKDSTVDGLTRVWRRVLEGVEPEQLRQAVDAWLREGDRYFPRPGTIRKHAIATRSGEPNAWDLEARYLSWEQHHDGPCPVCGGGLEECDVQDGAGRWHIVHEPTAHDAKGIPWVGRPYRDPPKRHA
jgi:hypothetical protein